MTCPDNSGDLFRSKSRLPKRDFEPTGVIAGVVAVGRADDRPHHFDDIWSRTQLEPFLAAGTNTVRLVTTRQHQVLPDTSAQVDVDAMATVEARGVRE